MPYLDIEYIFALFWFVLAIIFLILELMTVGLTSIWVSLGAFASTFFALLGAGFVWQVVIFVTVTIILLLFTKPFVKKYVTHYNVRTNCEELIGKTVKITETVNNLTSTGAAFVNGLEWTARSIDDNLILKKGTYAVVDSISGVKLILSKKESDPVAATQPKPKDTYKKEDVK